MQVKESGIANIVGNRITIRNDVSGKYYTLNKIKIKNKEFVDDIPKGRKQFKVRFYLKRGQPSDFSLEVVPDEHQSLETILRSVPDQRSTSSEKFSDSTDMSTGTSGCLLSSATTANDAIPEKAQRVTIETILVQANDGIEEIINDITEGKISKCAACRKDAHSEEVPMSFSTWYYLNESSRTEEGKLSVRALHRLSQLQKVLQVRPYCECSPEYKLKAIPRNPCNVFRRVSSKEKLRIDRAYEGTLAANLRSDTFPGWLDEIDFLREKTKSDRKEDTTAIAESMSSDDAPITVTFPVLGVIKDKHRINHIVPRSAGGCPTKAFDIVKEFKGEKVPSSNLITT